MDVSLKPRRARCTSCGLSAMCWRIAFAMTSKADLALCDTCCTRLAIFLGQREQ